MAGVTQTIPSYSAGMSEQPDNLKFPGQVVESVNAIPDITKGLFKRPGLKRIDSSLVDDSDRSHTTATGKLKDVQSGGSWFHYYRDETEGSYIGQIAADGQVRVWSCKNGELMTTLYGSITWSSTREYKSGDKVQSNILGNVRIYQAQATISSGGSPPTHSSGTVNNWLFVETAQANAQNYLATSSPENIQTLTINDTTFVSNRDTSNSNTAVGTTGTTDDTPDPHFALIELTRAENGRQYGLNITNGTTDATRDVTLKRATRIRIKSHTLNEEIGGGECLGIGTEVFDITASDDETAGDNKYTIGTNQVNSSGLSIININSHGYSIDDIFIYNSGGGSNLAPLEDNRDYYVAGITSPGSNGTSNAFNLSPFPDGSSLTLTSDGNNNQVLIPAEKGVVTNASGTLIKDGSKKNLVFRISTLGQQGNANNSTNNFVCSYQPEVTLLHGGEGWETGDIIRVAMTGQGLGGGGSKQNSPEDDTRVAVYTIEVTDHEETTIAAKYNGADTGLIRPSVTPFDADTTVTSDTILAGIKSAIENISGTPINAKVIGSNLYLSSNSEFNVEVVEEDLMRVMQDSVNDVTNLPNQCKHGYIVQVKNARMADEDDYYLRFDGQNNKDGSGAWSECAKPGIAKTLTNMPIVIQRTAAKTFTVKQFTYQDRRVGDDSTNPLPSFVNKRINKVLFFRNRLAFLSEENVILSRPGTLGTPDFFAESALTTSASDPIDISAASMFPSELFDGIEINTGLIVFSSNQQFLLTSDDTVLNPDTAKLKSIATFNYNVDMPPISLGTTVAYVDNSGRFSRLNEMANIAREGEPNIVEVSKVVPSLLPNDIDLLTNSRENSIVLMGKTGTNTVFGYKYLNIGDKRQQAAWFKWKLNKNLIYHFIIDDEYFVLDSDYYLQSMQLVESTEDLSITQDGVDYLLHLDNHVPLFGGNYSSATNKTTFTVPWLNQIPNAAYNLAVIDTIAGTDNIRLVRYQTTPVLQTSGTTLTLEGDWETGVSSSNPLHIGYVYDYQVTFPKFYPFKSAGEGKVQSDVNSSLVLHRVKLHFGKLGTYKTILERVGKTNYEEDYESSILDEYNTNSAPYLETYIKTVPIYERNTNITLTLKSTHPSPATLHALSWEADYSPRFYNRV